MKLQDVKLTDQMTRHEIAGQEFAGHEIAGQKNRKCSFRCYFINTQHYDALCVNDCL